MGYIAGVDEAGRGPLIGDLFMVLVVIDKDLEEFLKNIGVKDSKKLTKNRREELFKSIISIAKIVIASRIPPEDIDRENINHLELKTLCKILMKGCSIVKIDKVYVDAFANPAKIAQHLYQCLKGFDINNIVVAHGADNTYTVVGAASIIAKVLRDKHIDFLKQMYGDFGSGYPGDRSTIEWLKNYYQEHKILPPIVRKSWKTVNNVLSKFRTLNSYMPEKTFKP